MPPKIVQYRHPGWLTISLREGEPDPSIALPFLECQIKKQEDRLTCLDCDTIPVCRFCNRPYEEYRVLEWK